MIKRRHHAGERRRFESRPRCHKSSTVLFAGFVCSAMFFGTLLGLAAQGQDKPPRPSLEELSAAIEKNPSDAGAYAQRGALLLAQESYALAEADLDKAIALSGESAEPTIFFNRGLARSQQGKLDQAIEDFEKFVLLNPGDPDGPKQLGKTLNQRGRQKMTEQAYDSAEKDFDRGIAVGGEGADPALLFNRGLARLELGKSAEAASDFEAFARLKPEAGGGAQEVAVLLQERGGSKITEESYAAAEADLDKALALLGEQAGASLFYNRGLARRHLGKLEEALSDFETFAKMAPEDPDGAYQAGFTRWQLGRFEEALQDMERFLRMKPDDAYGAYMVGFIQGVMQRYPEAVSFYDKSLAMGGEKEVSKEDLPVLGQRAVARLEAGDPAGAIRDAEQFVKSSPDDATAHEALAVVLLAGGGDSAKAIAACEDALRLKPASALPSLLKSAALERTGRSEEAKKTLQAAAETKAADEDAAFYAGLASLALDGPSDKAERLLLLAREKSPASNSYRPYIELALWITRARTGATEGAQRELASYLAAQPAGRDFWPYPVLRFYAGQSGREEVLAAAEGNKRKAGEAHFYVGIKSLAEGRNPEAMRDLQQSADLAYPHPEFLIAHRELSALGKP